MMRKTKKVIALLLAVVTMFSVLSFQASACGIRGLVHGLFIRPCICTELKMLFCPVVRGLLDFMPHGRNWWHHRDWWHDEEEEKEEEIASYDIIYKSGTPNTEKELLLLIYEFFEESWFVEEEKTYSEEELVMSRSMTSKQATALKAYLAEKGVIVDIRAQQSQYK